MSELILLAEPSRLLFGAVLVGALCISFAHIWALRRAAQSMGAPMLRRAKSAS